jgi:drug/metabolite transporter (DMT)-like permease
MLELRRDDARMTRSKLTPRLALLLTLPPLLWAGNAVVGRLLVGQVPPLLLNALRWVLVLLILLPMAWPVVATAAARRVLLARWRPLALMGFLGVACFNALQYLALTTSTALNVTLIASSLPVWMLAIGALFYRQRPGRRALLGAVLSLAGVAVVLSRGDWAQLAEVRLVAGDLLMLAAVLAWAWYSWLLAHPPALLAGAQRPDWDWAAFQLAQTLFGVLFAGAAAALEQVVVAPVPVQWSPGVLLALVYVAVGASLIAYRCWARGVAAVGPPVAAFFVNLTPLFAALMSALLLGEPPQPFHALAFALIVAGIVASAKR